MGFSEAFLSQGKSVAWMASLFRERDGGKSKPLTSPLETKHLERQSSSYKGQAAISYTRS